MIDWNIQSRAHACQACGQPFADKATYHTLLSIARQTYERLDVCEACWTSQFSQGATERKGFISHWHAVYHVPVSTAAPDAIQKENAETLLRKLMEQADPRHAAAGYILAVMLERKRILKVKSQFKQDGRRVFVYEHAKDGDVFTIADPDLQLNQLEAVQRDVAQLLEQGLNPPATAPASATGAPETTTEPPTEAAAPVAPETPEPAPVAAN